MIRFPAPNGSCARFSVSRSATIVEQAGVQPISSTSPTVRFDKGDLALCDHSRDDPCGGLGGIHPWLFSWTGLALAVLGVPFYGMGIHSATHRFACSSPA